MSLSSKNSSQREAMLVAGETNDKAIFETTLASYGGRTLRAWAHCSAQTSGRILPIGRVKLWRWPEGVGHDLREVGFCDLAIPDNVREAVLGSMLPILPGIV